MGRRDTVGRILRGRAVAVVVLARIQECVLVTMSFPGIVHELPDAIAPVIQLLLQDTTLLFSQHIIFEKLPEHTTDLAPVFFQLAHLHTIQRP